MKRELEQFIVTGEITATSNKQSDDFVSENPRKTAYIKTDEENSKILKEQGLTEYTSKKDNEKFFIVKLSESIDLWDIESDEPQTLGTGIDTPNFYTVGKVELAIIKGFSKGNHFTRIFAIKYNKDNQIEIVEKTNPFSNGGGNDSFRPIDNSDIPF